MDAKACFELADILQEGSLRTVNERDHAVELEAARRVDQLFEIEGEIQWLSAAARLPARQHRSTPLLSDFGA
ncbi:hypothetical protein [Bradyrhizobium sp. DOA9]|uniref:hypothetical protein n=1 Tax=Bradyrhizobium sp. DOA9 TaxID=1126627 RepID=UPI0005A880D5|nr:hypothetical protein [Bradyrhizobium sp. DOA9]